ncbi:MAG: choice-of-anchor D domain-containing protein, partial [Rhodoferax sp.]
GARLAVEGTGSTTLGSGITVRGQGNIGSANIYGGVNVLSNNGLILADGGTLTITAPANSGSFAGTGTLQVNGGALNVSTGSASTQGKLVIGGTGTLGLGTQNLTLTSDYTNVQAGSGNSFDRRAGVSGTGQILAGGNAAQIITGTSVTDGNTNNATLTINNVRVGATNYNYQVANTGTTGPSLRGAIQTNVNGGNLTDGRLSGAGVTAGNYNTGAPGSNTGNLGVTFTAATAGALAPLSGPQVLNLRSNFENIADQKLNIVLGAGAAAFNAAVGSTATPVTVANQRVGGSNSTALVVSNTAAAGSFSEDLNATIASNSGAATSSGSISGRTAGSSSTGTGAITVGVNTSVAGARSGAVTLNYQTAGAVGGISNALGVASVGSQTINVNGNVYQVAQPTALPASVNLGNFRAGTAQSQTVTLSNTNISPPGFQEGLNATIVGATGAATGTGALNNVAAGSSGSLQIGVTGVAGINTGTVQVQLATNGTGTSGLGNLNLGAAQTVNVSGTGYRLASANSQPATVNFGNVLQGSAQAQFLSIQNTASGDGFSEGLDSSFLAGGTTGAATNNGGSVSLLAAGAAANNTAMAVGVNTGTIGAKSGQVIVAFDSNGSGTSGLGITGLPNQNIGVLANVSAVVGTLAQPGAVSPNPVNFGNFRVGDAGAGPASLSISNNATIGEGLNASIATGSGGFAANGAFTSLAPQATNNTSLQVSFNGTGTAGAKSGTATVTLVSDGTFNSGTPTALPSQTVALNANVFNVAQPTALPASVNVGSFRTTGSAITQAVSLGNTNISPAGFQEGLNANIVGTSGNGVATGALNNVGAGASGSLQVGVAGVAGINSGTVQVQLASNGTGTSGLGNLDLGAAKSVTVSGLGYTTAIGQVTTTVVDFGIVRVGDMVSTRNVTVQNTAAVTALNDSLRGNLSGVAGPFTTASNTVGGIAAGGATGNIAVGLNTSTAGISNKTGTVALLSQDADLADVSAGANASVLIKAQINNLANAHFGLFSGLGALSQSGDVYTLDLGDIVLNSFNALSLELGNYVTGPADDLSGGVFNLAGANDFTFSGFGPLGTLAAGQFSGNLDVSYLASALGMFTDTIAFDGFSTNASDPVGIAESRTLVIKANVINASNSVPEPGTLALMLMAAAAALLARRRRTMAH